MKLEDRYLTRECSMQFGIIDRHELAQLAYIVSNIKNGPILEIGTWLGKTAFTMSFYKKSNIILHLIDPFESSFGSFRYPEENIKEYYASMNPETPVEQIDKLQSLIYEHKGNLEAVKYVLADYLDTTVFHKTRSQDFVLDFSPEFAFVDGGHTYEEVYSDLEKILVHENCLIACHDYDQEPVKIACDTITAKFNRTSVVINQMAYILDKQETKKSIIIELSKLVNG
jgi:hypothetical protein